MYSQANTRKNVNALMERAGMDKEALANKLNCSYSQASYICDKSGVNKYKDAVRVCKAIGGTVDELLSDNRPTEKPASVIRNLMRADYLPFKTVLANIMSHHGYVGDELAEKTGISRSLINKWLKGDGHPKLSVVTDLCTFFGLKPVDIMGYKTVPFPKCATKSYEELKCTGSHVDKDVETKEDKDVRDFASDMEGLQLSIDEIKTEAKEKVGESKKEPVKEQNVKITNSDVDSAEEKFVKAELERFFGVKKLDVPTVKKVVDLDEFIDKKKAAQISAESGNDKVLEPVKATQPTKSPEPKKPIEQKKPLETVKPKESPKVAKQETINEGKLASDVAVHHWSEPQYDVIASFSGVSKDDVKKVITAISKVKEIAEAFGGKL